MTDITQGGFNAYDRIAIGARWSDSATIRSNRLTGTTTVPIAVLDVRRKHGYKGDSGSARRQTKGWREQVLSGTMQLDGVMVPKRVDGEWPKNRPVLDALVNKFGLMGFQWTTGTRMDTVKGRNGDGPTQVERKWVTIKNPPTIGGYTPDLATLLLIEPEMVDGYDQAAGVSEFKDRVGTPAGIEVEEVRKRMDDTGVGYKGLSGVSWRQMIKPLELPEDFLDRLGRIGRALRIGFQAICELYNSDASLRALLNFGKPVHIPEMMIGEHVGLMRPDIVIVKDPVTDVRRPVITELESCPGGQGMAHAMEIGYQLPTTMLSGYIQMLRGRKLIVLCTNEWAEYCWEQATFVAALRSAGVEAEIWFDKPLRDIHNRVQMDWIAPAAMSLKAKASWNKDFLGRLKSHGFDQFVHGSDEGLPQTLGPDTVVYRFGYFDNFVKTGAIDLMRRWHDQGAYIMNPLWYSLESKMLMAAFWHPSVMAWIRQRDPEALIELHNGVAETHSIKRYPQAVCELPSEWLTKIAAWDGNNQSWGSRGVTFGSQAQSMTKWEQHLADCARLPYPIVVQRFIISERHSVAYRDAHSNIAIDTGARTRLTPFFLFLDDSDHTVDLVGSTITLRSGSLRIHGADDACEGPAIFTTMEG